MKFRPKMLNNFIGNEIHNCSADGWSGRTHMIEWRMADVIPDKGHGRLDG
jgi:hypothetical protein